jgi:hypothetical protein
MAVQHAKRDILCVEEPLRDVSKFSAVEQFVLHVGGCPPPPILSVSLL